MAATNIFTRIDAAGELLDSEVAPVRLIFDEDAPPRESPPLSAYEDEPSAAGMNGHDKSGDARDKDKPPPTLVFKHISDIVAEMREPLWLLPDIIEKNVLAVIAGTRNSFKSFIALDWIMRAAQAGHGCLILSGEGAGLDRRIDAWMRIHAPGTDIDTLPVYVLERPINLTVAEIRALVVSTALTLPSRVDFVLVDTLSKFSAGLDESSNKEMSAFLSMVAVDLRDALSCTVLLVAHTGHTEQGRPRGAYALMANPDAEYIVSRQGDEMLATVSRERFKDTPSLPPLAYSARVVPLGRLDSRGKTVSSLALESTDAPQVKQKPGGINQQRALAALKEWSRSNPEATAITSLDITALFKAQKLDFRRRPEVMDYMVRVKILTPSVGGYTFDRAML